MGFLIFAYRKLSLKSRINDLNFRLMMLTQKEQSMTEKVGQMEQAMSSAKNMMAASNSTQMSRMTESILTKYYDKDANGKMTAKAGIDSNLVNQEMYKANYEAAAQNSVFSGAFDAVAKAQMTALNTQSTQISNQKANIESRLKQMNGELDGVEKAEDDAAKKDAPKFGLG